ncbi:MAG: hypothetical protein U9N61_03885, partial [Euryarchaeota archaeon]|nr:hypothetical protein [Euryarchaeota archaeon]
VSKNNDKFMVALGKIHKDRVPPSWSELYFFNVNEKDEEEIKILSNHLEQFMAILIAEKIKISEDWKEEIVNGVEHLERGVIKTDDDDMPRELGTYGGEVYASTLSVSGNTVNFSMSEHIIEDYIKKVIVKLTKAIGDLEVYSTIKNNKEIQHLIGDIENEKDTISRLKLLEEGLRRIYSDQTGVEPDIARPIYLLDIIKSGKINCEGYSALALYLITFNKQLFPEMDCIKICCVPIIPKYGLKDPHMFLILGHNGYKQIFDPTTITYGYKDKIISEVMGEERYYVDHKIIEIEGEIDG